MDYLVIFSPIYLCGQNSIVMAAAGCIYKPQILGVLFDRCLYGFMSAIIGIEIHLFDFAH